MSYFVYLLRCADNTFYCGYTTDLEERVKAHNKTNKAAKYTKSRRPVTLIYSEQHPTLSDALKREYEIKHLSRKEKEKLEETK